VAEEIAHLGDVGVEDQLPLPFECVVDGVGPDVGVAIHVAADPRTEAHERAGELVAGVSAVGCAQRRRHCIVESGNNVVDDIRQVEENVLDLVADAPPYPRMLGGLPHQGDLIPQTTGQGSLFRVRHDGVFEAVDQEACDALFLGEDGAPDRLGGVGGEHRFHEHSTDELAHSFDRQPVSREAEGDVLEAARLRRARLDVFEAATDALYALGHVDECEISRERPRHLGCLPGL